MDRRKEPAGRRYVVPFLYHIWAEISCSKNAQDWEVFLPEYLSQETWIISECEYTSS